MARTTAPYVGKKGTDRCRECSMKAEATVSGETSSGPASFRVCLSHTYRYVRANGVTVTPDPEANVALCACGHFVGHNGRAAHRCSAVAS